MPATTVTTQQHELAHRVGGGCEVTLYWNADDNSTSIHVHHIAGDMTMRYAVPGDQALDAFYHPLAHIGYRAP